MSGREHRALAGKDHDADGVIGFGARKRLIEFDQHAPVLGVALVGAVQRNPDDHAVVEGLPLQEFVIAHRSPLSSASGNGVIN